MRFFANHDLHVHTNLSSCARDHGASPQELVDFAEKNGYDTICITNHMWDSTVPGASEWYLPQNMEHIMEDLPLPKSASVRVLFGCETEFCGGRQLAIRPACFNRVDFVVIPPNHFHLTAPPDCDNIAKAAELFTTRLEELIALPLPWHKIGIAHLTTKLTYEDPPNAHFGVYALMPEARLMPVFRFLAQQGAGIELNAGCFRPGWRDFYEENLKLYRIAKEAGCKFYCCSDAHSIPALSGVKTNLSEVIDILGLSAADRYIVPL